MGMSAALMGALGIVASFLPQEALSAARVQVQGPTVVLVQITGALYLAFAFLNWTARGILIGGIYGRPIALANFAHFIISAITLIKFLTDETSIALAADAAVYSLFAVWFGLVLFTHPGSSATRSDSE